MGLHRIEIAIRPENVRSLRVVAKLGFRPEGLRPRYLHIDGDWRDHLVFALNAEEVPEGLLRRWENLRALSRIHPGPEPVEGPLDDMALSLSKTVSTFVTSVTSDSFRHTDQDREPRRPGTYGLHVGTTGVIFAAIAIAWLAYLVPHFVRRRDDEPTEDEVDPTDRFADSMRIVRHGTAPLLDQDLEEIERYEVSTRRPGARRSTIFVGWSPPPRCGAVACCWC